MIDHIHIFILAAGQSHRMGDINKLLLDMEGEPLIARSIRPFLSLFTHIHVVTGFEAAKVKTALGDTLEGTFGSRGINFIHNPDYEKGQDRSISKAMDAAMMRAVEDPKIDAVILALGDMPFLRCDDLKALMDHYLRGKRDKICVPFYGQNRGHPVIIPRIILENMEGALPRLFMKTHPQSWCKYNAPNANFITDVDQLPIEYPHDLPPPTDEKV